MSILARAPSLLVLTAVVSMLTLYECVTIWLLPVFAIIVILGMLLCCTGEGEGRFKTAVAVMACVIAASLWLLCFLSISVKIPVFVDTEAIVTSVRPWGRLTAVTVTSAQGRFVFKVRFANVCEGDNISLRGRPVPLRSDGEFREDRYWQARGINAQLRSPNYARLPTQRWNVYKWRYGLYRKLTIFMPPLTASYLNAAWTGKREEALNVSHRAWGTSHLLAISGFHVGLVIAAVSMLFRKGKCRVPLLSFALWTYIIFSGSSASAMRSGLMIQIALLGELAGRPASPINSVSLAALLLLLHSPFWFWDIGWRLSVLAALVIAAVLERASASDWRIWLVISPLIWLTTFPQVTATFDSVPSVGLLINLLAPAFFSFALSFASLMALLTLTSFPCAAYINGAIEGAFVLWGKIADFFVWLLPWQLSWNFPTVLCCAVIFVTLILRALFVPWKQVALLTPVLCLASFLLF